MNVLVELPPKAVALLVLAHGAGAGMAHPFLTALAKRLAAEGIATLRYQFPYMEAGKERPDPPKVLTAAVAAAVAEARAQQPHLRLFAGGKSMGGRMTTTAAAEGKLPEIRGIVCYGFPLHHAKAPAVTRAVHLAKVAVPTLFLQGTRDDLADLELMRGVVAELPDHMRMQEVQGADHSFAVLKSSGRTGAEVLAELAVETRRFVEGHR